MTKTGLLVGIASHPFVKGVYSASDEPEELLSRFSFDEAFDGEWPTDAHFVTYAPVGEGMDSSDPFPRVNKAAIGSIREQGYDVVRTMIALDWDTPDHKPWGETAEPQDFEVLLYDAVDCCPWLAQYACLYFTRGGVRLVYALSEPMAVEESEALNRWMVEDARGAGVDFDSLCDWSRLFRLPRVLRDGQRLSEALSFYVEVDADAVLDASKLGRSWGNHPSRYADIQPLDAPQPDEDEAASLIESFVNGKWKPTQWASEAKKRLKGRKCFDCVFNNVTLAKPGARDSTLTQYVGEAIGMLLSMRGTTPEHIFGLFVKPVSALGSDEDWMGKLWQLVCRMWALEDAKTRFEQQEEKEVEQKKLSAKERFLEGMRSWCNHKALSQEEDDAWRWAKTKMVVSTGMGYYIADQSGRYRGQQFRNNQLVPAMRAHLSDMADTTRIDRFGQMIDESTQVLINRHATVVDQVIAIPGIEHGYIENIDEPEATLYVPSFSINPMLRPMFDRDVDTWLNYLGGDLADDLKRWIAYALAFAEGSTCALSITGGAGVGKKMLVRGLSECLRSPKIATDQDIVGDWQYGLLRSPFLVINEGWPKGSPQGKDPADRFRELVSGDPVYANLKGRDLIEIRNPVRIILTGNNFNVIRVLADKKELTQEDRDALAIRLMHFDVGNDAGDWLRTRGGMEFTGRKGRRWVSPDAGGKSDYVVAQHFLWLYARRHEMWKPDRRLLVEGFGSDKLMFELQTQTGSSPLVVEMIIEMFNTPKANKTARTGLVETDMGRVYTTTSGLLDFWRECMSKKVRGRELTALGIKQALTGLSLPQEGRNAFKISGRESMGARKWIRIDIEKIARAAETHGYVSQRLDDAVRKARESGEGK